VLPVEARDGEADVRICMLMIGYDHPVRVRRLHKVEAAEGALSSHVAEELARGQLGNHFTSGRFWIK
jgi:hypothetical protein